jgi:hypothetical protein
LEGSVSSSEKRHPITWLTDSTRLECIAIVEVTTPDATDATVPTETMTCATLSLPTTREIASVVALECSRPLSLSTGSCVTEAVRLLRRLFVPFVLLPLGTKGEAVNGASGELVAFPGSNPVDVVGGDAEVGAKVAPGGSGVEGGLAVVVTRGTDVAPGEFVLLLLLLALRFRRGMEWV